MMNDDVKRSFDDIREREISKEKRLGRYVYTYICMNY
jgi:hypothetical protein